MHDRSKARRSFPVLLAAVGALLFLAGGLATPALAQGQSCDATGPVCDGDCPPGTACVTVGTAGQCRCEAIACGDAAFPTCDGECPAGQQCDVTPTGAQGCACGFPIAGTDLSPTSGVFTVELDASMGGQLVHARVDGELLLQWTDPQTDPATGERTVQTEILSMDLTGFDPVLGNVSVRAGRQLNLPASLGFVRAKQPESDFPALAAFDVFFEVEVDFNGTTSLLRNTEPLVMVAQIDELPPRNIGLQNQGPVVLFDNQNPNNPHVLRRAFHWMCPPPYPPPGVPCTIPCDRSGFPECFGEDCPPGLDCIPDDLSARCRCDTSGVCGDGVLDPGEQCDDGNNVDGDGCSANCTIEPGPCDTSPFPECGGACPAPTTCAPLTANGPCECVLPACEQGPFPECGGLCPNDGICTPQSLSADCRCEPPPACGDTHFPECDGLCDKADEECRQADDTDFCRCQKVEPFCEDIQGDPVCDGSCPPTASGNSQRCVSPPAGTTLPCECKPCSTVTPGSDTTILFTSARHYQWDALPCAESYNVYRAHGQSLVDSDTDGLADDYGACLITNVRLPQSRDSSIPLPGFLSTYLAAGLNDNGEGSLGHNSAGAARPNVNPCPVACQNGNDFPTCGGACASGETCRTDPSGAERCFCDQDGFPPGGTDLSTTVGHVTVDLSTGERVDLIVDGDTLLRFSDPQTDPATGERTVQTEILSMDLFGSHPSIGDVNVRAGRRFGLPPTLGKVHPPDIVRDFPALATFDVFFEVEIGGGLNKNHPVLVLLNDEPLVMEATIDQIPPRSIGLSNSLPVELTDADNPNQAATIQQSFHWMCPPPFPPPGEPCPVPCENSRPDQCLGDCPDANQVCTPDPAGGDCFCDTLPVACEDGPYPECGGECPPGSSCLGNAANGICRCIPDPVVCEQGPFPECGGDCPTGTHCEPTGTTVHLPSPQLPPEPNPPDCDQVVSQYEGEDLHARFPNGVDFSNPIHKCFRNVATTTQGADEVESFDSTVEGLVDVGGGPTPVVLSGPVTTIARGKAGQTTGSWDTEIVSMSLSGNVGGIPVEIRESPSRSSSGRTTVSPNDDGFIVDSFFDVWTEISVDGGPFEPQTNPAGRMRLVPANPGTPDTCECVPDVVPCEQGPFPECGGDCPDGLTCIQDPGVEECVCGTPVPCEQGPYPECGGECPPEHVCREQTDVGIDECRCEREFPGAGFDLSPTVGHVTVDLSTGETAELIVSGDTLLQFGDPQTDPATGERTVQTEILSMDLTGFHPSIGDVNVKAGRDFGLPKTKGKVTPLSPGSDFPALATFDVFFEVEVPGVATLRNEEPLVMQAEIDQIPPRNLGLQNQQPVDLTDIQDPTHVDTIRRSFHWMCPPPFPPPGQPCPVPCENSRPDQCLGDCPDTNQVCTPDPAGGPCFCDTPPVACEQGPFPECGGECPPGSSCLGNAANEICRCIPDPVVCEQGPFPECGGDCPTGTHCEPTGTTVTLPSAQLPPDANPPDCDSVVAQYEGEDLHARFPNGVDFSNPIHKCFRNVATTTEGADEIETFDSTVEGMVDVGGGPTPVVLSGPVVTRVSGKAGQTTGSWDTEIVSMSLSGNVGGIPVEIRESPTRSSAGQTTIVNNGDGTFIVDSFFDVWTEISVDGGPWEPQTNPAGRMTLRPASGTADTCECVPDPVPCEQGPFPECGGDCPDGLTCIQDPGVEECVCGTPVPCEQGPYPECGGECPPEHVCREQTDVGIDECRCEREFPGAGFDLSPTVGHVTVDLSTGETADLIVSGDTLLQFGDPQTDPATGERTVQTEILSMDLTGFHPSIGDVNVKAGRDFGLPKTKGKVTPSSPGSDFPALATFDVFFEVEVPGVATLRNEEPLVMQADIDQIPPRNLGLQNLQPVDLTDIQDPTHVDTIRRSFHWMCPPPFPPPGQPCPVPCENSRPDQCLGDCPDANQVCTPDPAGGPCFCDAPVACTDSEAPVCDGIGCPPGTICKTDQGSCRCQTPTCADEQFPVCDDGRCPPGRECRPNAATDACSCFAIPCSQSALPECGGNCPAGDVCIAGQTACFCAPQQCEQSEPQCGGACPGGLVCTTDPAGGNCFCANPQPCDQSPFPTCGGDCSNLPGTTCLEVPGAQACRCQ